MLGSLCISNNTEQISNGIPEKDYEKKKVSYLAKNPMDESDVTHKKPRIEETENSSSNSIKDQTNYKVRRIDSGYDESNKKRRYRVKLSIYQSSCNNNLIVN